MASVLAWRVRPKEHMLGLSAGVLLIVFYLLLGAFLFFVPADGGVSFKLGDEALPFVLALLASSLALLFLYAVARRTRGVAMAVITFAVVAAWGGVVGLLREQNASPKFDLTAMLRKSETGLNGKPAARGPVSGYLIARTDDALLVARNSASFTTEAWRIVVIPRDQVEEMSVGPLCVVTEENLQLAAELAEELRSEHDPPVPKRPSHPQKLSRCAPEA